MEAAKWHHRGASSTNRAGCREVTCVPVELKGRCLGKEYILIYTASSIHKQLIRPSNSFCDKKLLRKQLQWPWYVLLLDLIV